MCYEHLPLFDGRPGFTLVVDDLVHHNLVRVLRRVLRVSLTPVVANGVGKDGSGVVEAGGGDGASSGGVTLETVLGVLVPEVECAVRASCAKGAVDRVE